MIRQGWTGRKCVVTVGTAAVVSLGLSGCGSTTTEKTVATTTTETQTATLAAKHQQTQLAAPDARSTGEPSPWERRTDAGATRFVEHWVHTLNAAHRTGNAIELRQLTTDTCAGCERLATAAEAAKAKQPWQIEKVRLAPEDPNGVRAVQVTLERGDERRRFAADLEWLGYGWRISGLTRSE